MPASAEDSKIAARYARALFEQALEVGSLDVVLADLQAVRQLFSEVPDLAVFLANPGIPKAEKLGFVERELAQKVSPVVGNLFRLMLENDRIGLTAPLAEKYQELLNQHHNVAHAEVMTATPLDAEITQQLEATLKDLYGYARVDLENTVDPAVLGGAVIRMRDQVIDGSYAGKLESLKKTLMA